MPDDHSKLVPLLPIPNRTVKRLSADDSAGSRVKVGHRQAVTAAESPARLSGAFCSVHPASAGVFGDSLVKNLQTHCKFAHYCAILAGFADRSELT